MQKAVALALASATCLRYKSQARWSSRLRLSAASPPTSRRSTDDRNAAAGLVVARPRTLAVAARVAADSRLRLPRLHYMLQCLQVFPELALACPLLKRLQQLEDATRFNVHGSREARPTGHLLKVR